VGARENRYILDWDYESLLKGGGKRKNPSEGKERKGEGVPIGKGAYTKTQATKERIISRD